MRVVIDDTIVLPLVAPPVYTVNHHKSQILLPQAPEDLQNAALGLYDARLNTRFALSDVQLQTLRLIGASGTQGALQSQLATAVGSENRNFFYVIRVRMFMSVSVVRMTLVLAW